MKRLAMTLAMATVLSVSVLAGDMSTGDFHSPATSDPPPGIITTSPCSSASEPGDIPTSEAAQLVFEDALLALLSVLGLVV